MEIKRGDCMRTYLVRFNINGKPFETGINANSSLDAKRAVEMQYPGQKVTIINCKDMTTGYYT